MKKLFVFIPLITVLLLIPGCTLKYKGVNKTASESKDENFNAPKTSVNGNFSDNILVDLPPAPDKDKASLCGYIIIPSIGRVRNTQIYLTPAEGESMEIPPPLLIVGGLETRGDIIGYTDNRGYFEFVNIPPGIYYLVISYGNIAVYAVKSDGSSPLQIKLLPNQRVNLGLVISPPG